MAGSEEARRAEPALRPASETPLLTVIVPVYNEVQTIDRLLRRVLAAPYNKQVIVVDDGSTLYAGFSERQQPFVT
jgi:cellulose synthase/poly-beta-1,6-N-acetylglucosamine synthase-like glycosyltransferase